MESLIWTNKPELRDPVLVAAFKGWNDAGESATAAVGFLVESFDAVEVARVDPEEFFDFTAVRPTVRLTEGRARAIDWPATVITAAHIPAADRDLVFLQGVEPSLRWRTFTTRDRRGCLRAGREARAHPRRAARGRAALARRERVRAGLRSGTDRPAGPRAHHLRGAHGHRRRAPRRLPASEHPVGQPVGGRAALRGRRAQPQGGAGARATLRGNRRRGRGRQRARGGHARTTSGR